MGAPMEKKEFFRRTAILLLAGASGSCLILALRTGWLWLAFPGMPFFLFLLILGHETGHMVGCLLNRNKITGLRVPLFTVSGRKLSFDCNIFARSYCAFLTSPCDALVYLCGPLASLCIGAAVVGGYLASPKNNAAALCAFAAAVHTVLNWLPSAHSDLVRVKKEIERKRNAI